MMTRARDNNQAGRRCTACTVLLGLALAATFPARADTDLTALSLEQLLDVTVVGASKYEQKQSEVAASVSVITRDEIRTFGWRTLADAINSLPGVHITYDRQYSYFGMRGFGLPGDYNTRLLLTINGNRTNDVVYDAALLGREFPLDMDLIERIEFIPGPGGAVYGQNAMFGVINVITRSGAAVNGTELAAAYQDPQILRQGRASWGKLFDNGVDFLMSISGMRARGEDRFFDFGAAGISGVARNLDGERDREFFTRVARGPWSAEFVYGDRTKDDPTGSFNSDPLVAGQYERDRNLHAQIQYQDNFAGDTLQMSGRLFLSEQRFTGIFSYGSPFLSTGSSDWRGGELRLLSTAIAHHKLMIGAEYQYNARVDQTFEDQLAPINDIVINQSGHRLGVFAQDEWRIIDALTATLGVRLDRNSQSSTEASPRAALIWQATAESTFKALYGRARRAPNSFERDYGDGVSQVANPSLGDEVVNTAELVLDQSIARDLGARASIYRWKLNGLIRQGIDPVSGLAQFQSGDEVSAKGLELSANKTWGWGGHLRGSLSLQSVSNASGATEVNSPQRLIKLNFSTPLPVADMRMGYELQYDSSRHTLNGTNLGGYALSNIYLTTDRWLKGVELSAGIYNLFDKRYQQPAADNNWQNSLEQDGRSARIEARYKF